MTEPDVAESTPDAPKKEPSTVPTWALVVSSIGALVLGVAVTAGATQGAVHAVEAERDDALVEVDELQGETDSVRACVRFSADAVGLALDDMDSDGEDMWNAVLDFASDGDVITLGDTAAAAKYDLELDYDSATTSLSGAYLC